MSEIIDEGIVSKSEARNKLDQFKKQGFHIIPYENLEKAVGGFVTTDENNTDIIVQFNLFDEEFESECNNDVTPEELLNFAESTDVYHCDDPKRLLMGFVHFDMENKKSVTKRCKISKLKQSDIGKNVLSMWRQIKEKDTPFCISYKDDIGSVIIK